MATTPKSAANKDHPSFKKDSWPLIRRAALALAFSVVTGSSLIALSLWTRESWQDNLHEAQRIRGELRQRVRQAETEKHEINDFQAKFESLRQRGLIGEERRLDWVEAIKKNHEQNRLLPMSYDFAAQKTFRVASTVTMGDLDLRATKMTLHLDMLHELDLLRFLEALPQDAHPVVQKCLLARPPSRGLLPLAPRLTADCTIYWVTLFDRTESVNNAP